MNQFRVIWEERTSVEGFPRSDKPVAMSVKYLLIDN